MTGMISWTRVTERSMAQRTIVGLQGNLAKLGNLQAQLSSGKLIAKPSDSPSGTVAAMSYRGDLRALGQYSRNIEDGKGWLRTADDTLTGALDLVHQARNLVVEGASSGNNDQSSRDAMAGEVDRLRESLLTAANVAYLGRPVFGGTTTNTQAYDATGGYVGDTGAVQRSVADGVRIRVDGSGPDTFGSGPGNLFAVLAKVAADLRTAPANLAGDLDPLDASLNRMQAQLSDIGARYDQIDQLGNATTARAAELQQQLSDIEDIDMPKTIMELQLQQTAYQVALGATARVIQPSLQQFLRT
jgi:flagellar hook-associated protein 3 FlgL